MAFEKEIKAAKKIADDWLDKSKGYEMAFIAMKKANVAWEKHAIKDIQGYIDANDLKRAVDAVDGARANLDQITKQCEKDAEEHNKFIMGSPRRGAVGVCEEMNLGSKQPAYTAVMESLTKVLVAHSKQFKATESAWKQDLLVRLNLLQSNLDTLEKLAKGEGNKMIAYAKQLEKDTAAYKIQMEKAVNALKADAAERVIQDINSDKANWMGGHPKKQQDQLAVLQHRESLIDQLIALSDKNYNRVLKGLPENVRKQTFALGKQLKDLNAAHDKATKDLNSAKLTFKMAIAVVQKSYPGLD
jgi:hypothetical protein